MVINVQIRLGYVAIATTLDDVTTSRILTYTHFDNFNISKKE
jgi:UV DNA damage repair endonuclease